MLNVKLVGASRNLQALKGSDKTFVIVTWEMEYKFVHGVAY